MAQFWTRKNDKEDETRCINPWDEAEMNGDKQWHPDDDDEQNNGQSTPNIIYL